MIKHPTTRELAESNNYPSAQKTYAAAGLGVLSVPKKSENNWIAQKSRKTHFHLPGKSSPANNSELLNDGSAQARAILGAYEVLRSDEEAITKEGAGVRRHALNYLKGKNVNFMGLWTRVIMGEPEDVPTTGA